MKNFVTIGLILFLLSGCNNSGKETEMASGKSIKANIQKAQPKKKTKKFKLTKLSNKSFDKATKKDIPLTYRYGKINGIHFDKALKNNNIPKITNDFLNFEDGWAYDPLSKQDAAGLILLINEKTYEVKYGMVRNDVQKYANAPNVLKCGIKDRIDISNLKKGVHNLQFRVLSTNKRKYYDSPSIKFEKI